MSPKEHPDREAWLEEIVSLTEAAALRKISVESLRILIRGGKLRAIQQTLRKRGMTRREALRSDLR
jgi:hypothetical protein